MPPAAGGGVRKLGITGTDSPVVPQEELAYRHEHGLLLRLEALRGAEVITKIPAEALMMDHRLGKITVGLDADFCLWTGGPIDPRSSCEMTVIDGEVTYEASEKRVFTRIIQWTWILALLAGVSSDLLAGDRVTVIRAGSVITGTGETISPGEVVSKTARSP